MGTTDAPTIWWSNDDEDGYAYNESQNLKLGRMKNKEGERYESQIHSKPKTTKERIPEKIRNADIQANMHKRKNDIFIWNIKKLRNEVTELL